MTIRTIDADSPLGDKLSKVLVAVMKSYDSSVTQLGLSREGNAAVPILFTNLILLSMYIQHGLDSNDHQDAFQQHGSQLLACLEQIALELKEISNESQS